MAEKKRGKLSKEDQDIIKANVNKLTVGQIAEKLNRHEEPIRRFIKKAGLISSEMDPQDAKRIDLLGKLRGKPYWKEVQGQLTEEEIRYFENTWVSLMTQFQENILYSEEIQMKQWIILDILLNRSMKDRKRNLETMDALEVQLERERQREPPNAEYIMMLDQQLGMIRASVTAYSNEHTKLLDKISTISKDLKANRNERIDRIETGHDTFTNWLRDLENEVKRVSVGEEVELIRIAADKVHGELTEYHTYGDGQVDRPLFTPESVNKDD